MPGSCFSVCVGSIEAVMLWEFGMFRVFGGC